MPPTIAPEDMPFRVSFHAITRYVQRILGVVVEVDVGVVAPELFERVRAERHCAAIGRTVADLRREIMVPAVAVASAIGASFVNTKRFRAKIAPENGVVVTVTEPRKVSKRRQRQGSKREHQQRTRELNRRQKRRPNGLRYPGPKP